MPPCFGNWSYAGKEQHTCSPRKMYNSLVTLSFLRKLAPYDGLLSCLQSHGNAQQFSSPVLVLPGSLVLKAFVPLGSHVINSSIWQFKNKKKKKGKVSVLSIMKEPERMFDQRYIRPSLVMVVQERSVCPDIILLHHWGFCFLLGPSDLAYKMAVQDRPQCSSWVSFSCSSWKMISILR